MSGQELAQQGLLSSAVEWGGDLVGHEFSDDTLDWMSSAENSVKDAVGINSAMTFINSMAAGGAAPGFLGPVAGPIGSLIAGGANMIEGGAGLLDGEWNEADWGNAGKLGGGLLATLAGGTALAGTTIAGTAVAPYLAAGAATGGLGMRGNSFMNEHMGMGYGDAMGYGDGMASVATDGLTSLLGLEEDSFGAGALEVVGGLGDVGAEMVTNPVGSMVAGTTLGIGAAAGVTEDIVNFAGGFFGAEDAGSDMMDWIFEEDEEGNGLGVGDMLAGVNEATDYLSPGQWMASGVDWLFGD